jgi:hypothetical protein
MTGDQSRALEVVRAMAPPGGVREDEGYLVVDSGDSGSGAEFVPEMVRRLVGDGVDILAVVPAIEQGLEDMFLELTAEGEAR